MVLLIQLFLAHIIGDFFLQPSKWVDEKKAKKWKSKYLYIHVIIHFSLIILITLKPDLWKEALVIAIMHLLIDASKLQFQKEATARTWFFVDQLLHVATIVAVWACKEKMTIDFAWLSDKNNLALTTAVLFLIYPASFIIKTIVSKWAPKSEIKPEQANEIDQNKPDTAADSLVNAGQLIGVIERLLVFVFIILGKWEGVGFLLAAKSVFRFGDLKDKNGVKLTEYVLIGTLISFGIAVMTGIITINLMKG